MDGRRSGISALIALLLALALIGACTADDYRLSRGVLPSLYNISIRPYLLISDADKQFSFDGDVSITLYGIDEGVQQITLHKDYIEILDCWLYDVAGNLLEEIASERLIYEEQTDKLTVPLTQVMLANQNYTLRFKYIGQMRDGMAGLFRANYIEEQTGDIKWLGVTQMQRIDARVVFPCFDEPAFKAKFQLHITRPDNYNAISNTKIIGSTAEGNGLYVDHFDVTPVMSTYLVAFIISEYTSRKSSDGNFAVISRPEFFDKTKFSFSVGERTLQAYNELFKQPYSELGNELLQYASSPKFPHNGMENWGLIIYSDAVLVQEPGYTDGWSNKEFTIRIIAHETSHMWFGDSVTFQWWSYFWLNEAFARYYEYFMAHQLYPEYQLDQQFVVRQLQLIFKNDALVGTQPMTSPEATIETPSEIGYKFSSIAYAKGASIVRMWRNAMGHENFDASISEYLKMYHGSNTVPQHLFDCLKQHWPAQQIVDLDQFFYDYTEQVGYPVLYVKRVQENGRISFEHNRYLLSPSDGSDTTIRYTIPITYTTNLSPNFQNLTPSFYIQKNASTYYLDLNQHIDWIVVNLRQSNYYRVFYDSGLLQRLQLALSASGHSGVAVENRAQIIDDLFNFAHAEMLDYVEVFKFMEYLVEETEYVPWYAVYDGLERVAPRLTLEQLTCFSIYLQDITKKVFDRLGIVRPNDTVLDVFNRNKQVSWLCKYQHKECNKQVLETVTSLETQAEKPLPDFRETLYCAASRAGKYATILGYYRTETYPSEQHMLWLAASCTSDYRAHYENEILGNVTVSLITSGVAQLYQQNPEHVTPIFEMLTDDIKKLADALDSWSETAKVLSELAGYFTTRTQKQMLEEFIAQNGSLFGRSVDTLHTAVQDVGDNLEWSEKRLGRLVQYLGERNSGTIKKLLNVLLLLPMLSLSLRLKL
ncbi:aminopeptidase N [Scaptodrosophila lebanonensis]|uniref:Aminopeptidase n=1 Tax=Drosophila lebanonensis TaxID=7225 RepID=A0A6J2SZH8_DROLE|nr:aminopeptidase N [Scaptodrosophila lebanonensis]